MVQISDEEFYDFYSKYTTPWHNFRQQFFLIETEENLTKSGCPDIYAFAKKSLIMPGFLPEWCSPEFIEWSKNKHFNKLQLENVKLFNVETKEVIEGPKLKLMFEQNLTSTEITRIIFNRTRIKNFISISDDTRAKISAPKKSRTVSNDTKEKISAPKQNIISVTEDEDVEPNGNSGSNHHSFDHKIYNFVHKSGLKISCTQHYLKNTFENVNHTISKVTRGIYKSHSGWSLDKENL